MIRNKYTPLANAIRRHLPCIAVDILPIVISRKGTPHTSTIINLTSLLNLRNNPLDKLVSKTRIDTTRILSHLYLHAAQWMHHLLLIYRINSRTTTRHSSTNHSRTYP
jgi:hypothetical protein